MTILQKNRWLLLIVGVVAVIAVAVGVIAAQDSEDSDATDTAAADVAAGDTNEAQLVEHDPEYVAWLAEHRDPDVPDLPFNDNPDPAQCGIPSNWSGDAAAWLNGYYEGKLVQAEVLLYDSHSRLSIKASAPHGTQVAIVLFQNNPVTNYYMVNVFDDSGEKIGEGWIPEPFLSFEPVDLLPDGA